MKRSRSVRRVLLGGLSAGALSCASAAAPRVTAENYYTNDIHIPGAGYYHAPYRGFYPYPYNHYDAQRRLYFHGGRWDANPHRSIVNISNPTPEAVRAAQAMRTDVSRGGFGSTSRSQFIHS